MNHTTRCVPIPVVCRAVASAVLLVAAAIGQYSWNSHVGPVGAHMAYGYDPVRGRAVAVAIDGSTYELIDPDTDLWSGLLAVGPPRTGYSFMPVSGLAYAWGRQRIVCLDRNAAGPSGATWEWQGGGWNVITHPVGVVIEFLFSHKARGTVLGFGGPAVPPHPRDELLEWNGTSWTTLPATVRPPRPANGNDPYLYLSAAYDERRDRVVLFGGAHQSTYLYNITPVIWEWDATNGWVQQNVILTLPLTGRPMLHFDSHRGTLVALVRDSLGRTRAFEWDGGPIWLEFASTWAPAGLGVDTRSSAFERSRGRLLTQRFDSGVDLYYGARFSNASEALFEVRGAGCPGSLGNPSLTLREPWERAWLGGVIVLQLERLLLSNAMLVIGMSDQQHGSIPLPASLAPFGMPGCLARVSMDVVLGASGANNIATYGIPVPNVATLNRMVLHAQALVPDPAANAGGAAVSNSVRVTLGTR